jgi:hypothetical protein
MASATEIVYVLSSQSMVIYHSHSVYSSHGPLFLGAAFNVLLYGISITQTYLYLTSSKVYVSVRCTWFFL